MTYEIIFTARAEKDFGKLDHKAKERILAALERIRIRPERHVSKLVGDPCFKLRVGDYRVILDIKQDKLIILVIKIGHRRNIYKSG